jgi:hypothetical protein
MSTFYDPGPLPGWPTGTPKGRPAGVEPAGNPDRQTVDGADKSPSDSLPGGQATTQNVARSSGGAGGQLPVMNIARSGPETQGQPGGAAEARVRELRDAVQSAANRLLSGESVLLREFHDELWVACTALQRGDLGSDGANIGQQFEAFFERIRGLADGETEPVPTTSLGLPADARFLQDMAEYLTRNYALEADE